MSEFAQGILCGIAGTLLTIFALGAIAMLCDDSDDPANGDSYLPRPDSEKD